MPFSSSDHPLQPCWDLAVAAVQADALACALEADLFGRLPGDATAVAATLEWKPHAAAHLLELLWSMRLLERETLDGEGDLLRRHRYRSAPVAARYLDRAAADRCGDAWLYRLRSLRHFGASLGQHLAVDVAEPAGQKQAFHTGRAVDWAEAARVQIGQEQRAVTVASALDIVTRLPEFGRMRRGLDLGGGPGWVAIALAGRHETAQFTVFDWPETVAVAQENIERAGLAARMRALPGDLAQDDIGSGYDLIWCSLVLYFMADQDAALAKMFAALAPGGVLVCVHAELSEDAAAAARVAPYYLPMRMLGRQVPSTGELEQRLRRAGFTGIGRSTRTDFPMTPVQVLTARRPA